MNTTSDDRPYFVMLNTQRGVRVVPMTDPEGVLHQYRSLKEAAQAARTTVLGEHFGFNVFCLYEGLDDAH